MLHRNVFRTLSNIYDGAFLFIFVGSFTIKSVKASVMQEFILSQGVSQKFPIWAVRRNLGISELWSRGFRDLL